MKTQRHTLLLRTKINTRTVSSRRLRELHGYFRDVILSTHSPFLSVSPSFPLPQY